MGLGEWTEACRGNGLGWGGGGGAGDARSDTSHAWGAWEDMLVAYAPRLLLDLMFHNSFSSYYHIQTEEEFLGPLHPSSHSPSCLGPLTQPPAFLGPITNKKTITHMETSFGRTFSPQKKSPSKGCFVHVIKKIVCCRLSPLVQKYMGGDINFFYKRKTSFSCGFLLFLFFKIRMPFVLAFLCYI